MDFFFRCVRSYSRGEKIVSLFAMFSLIISAWTLFAPKADGDDYQSYHEASVGEIIRLNPLYTDYNPVDADISALIFSSLIAYDPYEQLFKPDLANYSVSEDALTYTFTLKNGLEWEDGEAITSRDITFTFQDVIQNEGFENKLLHANFQGVKLDVLNDLTVVFTLAAPNQFFLSNFTRGLLPYHKLKNEEVGQLDSVAWNKKPLASGPYRIYEPMTEDENGIQSIVLTVNEKYHSEKPSIKNIKFFIFPTFEDLVKNRSMWHAVGRVPFENKKLFEGDTTLKFMPYTLQSYMAIFINTDRGVLINRSMRAALAKSFPKEILYKEIPETSYLHIPVFASKLFADFKVSNLSEAKQLLDEVDGSEKPLKLIRRDFTYDNPFLEEQWRVWFSLYAENLKKVGVSLEIEALPLITLQKRIKERDYDMLLYGQSLGLNADLFAFWHSSQTGGNGLNLSNYQSPKADRLIEALRSEKDVNIENWMDLLQTLDEDVPAIFLYTPTYYYVTEKRVEIPVWQRLLEAKDRFFHISSWNFKL